MTEDIYVQLETNEPGTRHMQVEVFMVVPRATEKPVDLAEKSMVVAKHVEVLNKPSDEVAT